MISKDLPMWRSLELDIQSLCNRDCHFCPRYEDRSGVRKDSVGNKVNQEMPTFNVLSIIDQAYRLNYKGLVSFHGLSEPFLDERFFKFAEYVRKKGMVLSIYTNGDKLRQNERLRRQVDGLVNILAVGLYDYKTLNEKRKLMQIWQGWFKKTRVLFSLPKEYCAIRAGTEPYKKVHKKPETLEEPCLDTYRLLIRYDGEVSLCCEDDLCEVGIGNAFSQSLLSLWWSDKHMEVVNNLKLPGNRHKYKPCSICYKSQGPIINIFSD
jgi:organic radical activating enzyme